MREGIGSVFLYNIIIIFIVITFGFLSASLSYLKAFKVNGRIANSIEKFEGYNSLSIEEITNTLNILGYRKQDIDCNESIPEGYQETDVKDDRKIHEYCVYRSIESINGYYTYKIVTYIHLDIPLVGGVFKIPVKSETETIFRFGA